MVIKIDKVKIKEQTRKLKGTWTYESVTGACEISDELVNSVAKIMQEERDWEVITEIYVKAGWTKIQLPTTRSDDKNIEDWFSENIKGHCRGHNNCWLFENADDAAWFLLRWSS